MKIEISFLDGKKQSASLNGLEVISDANQENGGEGQYPEPFDYFAASLSLCSGHYAREFCVARKIDFKSMKLETEVSKDEKGKYLFKTNVTLPPDFPAKYHKAILATLSKCTVKKAIQSEPVFEYLIV